MLQSFFNHKLIIGLNDLFHCNIINQCKFTRISIVSGIPQKMWPVLVATCHCCLPNLSFSLIQTILLSQRMGRWLKLLLVRQQSAVDQRVWILV